MRRLPILLGIVSVLCACAGTPSTNAGQSPPVLGTKEVEAVFRRTHLVMLPNLAAEPPKGEVMDYGFIERGTDRRVSATVIVYPTSDRARRSAVVHQHGVVTERYMIPASRTLRVRNVVLIFESDIRKDDVRVLTRALSRLGETVSP